MAIKRKADRLISPVDQAPLRGRPRKLIPDEATFRLVKGLGQLQATTRECAAFLGVDEKTYLKFKKDNPDVQEVYDLGAGLGCVSLRRVQFAMAPKSAPMAIFLGKNYLGQTDRIEHAGDPNQPVTFIVQRTGRSKDAA